MSKTIGPQMQFQFQEMCRFKGHERLVTATLHRLINIHLGKPIFRIPIVRLTVVNSRFNLGKVAFEYSAVYLVH